MFKFTWKKFIKNILINIFTYLYFDILIKKSFFFCKNNLKKINKPFSKSQRAEISKLPLMDSFRTFKGNMIIEKIRFN